MKDEHQTPAQLVEEGCRLLRLAVAQAFKDARNGRDVPSQETFTISGAVIAVLTLFQQRLEIAEFRRQASAPSGGEGRDG